MPVQDIADQLGVSHMTVRRDLEVLAADQQIRVIHGGALLNPAVYTVGDSSYSLIAAGSVNAEQKRRIGSAAVGLIERDDTLIIDSGSTTEWIARFLPEESALTVLSYALNILTETVRKGGCRSVFAGGTMHANTLMFESPEGLDLVRRFRARRAFISAAGVSLQSGVTCANGYERATKRAAMDSAALKILVVDSTKFGSIRSEHFADIEEFDTVVTDGGINAEDSVALRERGLTVIVAS
jgi:DeoR family deoxyribose operon repressor